jgi:hypothetical protein
VEQQVYQTYFATQHMTFCALQYAFLNFLSTSFWGRVLEQHFLHLNSRPSKTGFIQLPILNQYLQFTCEFLYRKGTTSQPQEQEYQGSRLLPAIHSKTHRKQNRTATMGGTYLQYTIFLKPVMSNTANGYKSCVIFWSKTP